MSDLFEKTRKGIIFAVQFNRDRVLVRFIMPLNSPYMDEIKSHLENLDKRPGQAKQDLDVTAYFYERGFDAFPNGDWITFIKQVE